MIDVKKAAENAVEYLTGILGDKTFQGLEIEEVELSEDEQFWFITIGYYDSPLMMRRKYKIFKIRASDGKVFSMKIREVA
jgi:hypothetical protein